MTDIFIILAALYACWMLYVLVMGLYRAHQKGRIPRWSATWVLGMPIVAVAYAANAVLNVTLASVVFLDAPRELQVTGRLKRYMDGPDGWRRRAADWVCTHLLDPLAPDGDHC